MGCGKPPTRDDDDLEALWQEHGVHYISPYQAVEAGLPPYRKIGFGPVVSDWPWCPRWFASRLEGETWGSEASIDGIPTEIYIRSVYPFWDRGMLGDLVKPPWTPGLVDALLFFDQLEKVEKLNKEKIGYEGFMHTLEDKFGK